MTRNTKIAVFMLLQRVHSAKKYKILERLARRISFGSSSLFLYNLCIICLPFAKSIQRAYESSCQRSIEAKVLPVIEEGNADSILEIGGGVGGNLMCLAKLRHPKRVSLLDVDSFSPAWGYGSGGEYNDIDISLSYLRHETPEGIKLSTFNGSSSDFKNNSQKFDFVFSLIAWGFHFPLETYLEAVVKKLNPAGYGLVEVRLDKLEEECRMLFQYFENVEIQYKEEKLAGVAFSGIRTSTENATKLN